MIRVRGFDGVAVAVLGLGRAGRASARALAAGGARVRAWDDDPAARAAAGAAGIPVVDLAAEGLDGVSTLVLSPGIPHTHPKPHPLAARAKARGCRIIGEVELLYRSRPEARLVGITGTNGKSTTTALLGHILARAGWPVQVGANLGVPALELEPLDYDGTYVLEMSSYQLELTETLAFSVAVLLNITPDHLDRHGGMAGYIKAKEAVFARQATADTAVVGIDDLDSRTVYESLRMRRAQRVVPISAAEPLADGGVSAAGGRLRDAGEAVMDLRPVVTLPGPHNWQNAAAAFAAARAVGVGAQAIAAAIATYPGLPHRQERVATIDGVLYVNDSKATNPDAAAKALASYDRIYWIAGGRPKQGGFATLLPFLERVAGAFLIGEAAGEMANAFAGRVDLEIAGDLETALHTARARALAERGGASAPVVLLAPACASFDQFADFEARGTVFRDLVRALPGRRRDAKGGDRP